MEPLGQKASPEAASPASDQTNPFTPAEYNSILKKHAKKSPPSFKKAQWQNATDPATADDLNATTKAPEQADPPSDKEAASNAANDWKPSISKVVSKRRKTKFTPPNYKGAERDDESSPVLKRLLGGRKADGDASCTEREANQEPQIAQDSATPEEPSDIYQDALDAAGQGGPDTACQRSIKRAAFAPGTKNVINMDMRLTGVLQCENLQITEGELIFNQSDHHVSAKLVTTFYSNKKKSLPERLSLKLFFDPNSNYALLVFDDISAEDKAIVVKEPNPSADLPMVVRRREKVVLRKALYGVFWSDQHILNITIFPRRYISLPQQNSQLVVRRDKRSRESSSSEPDPPTDKRAKITKMGDVSNAGTVVCSKSSEDEPILVHQPDNGISDWILNADICHPLERLKLDDVVDIATEGEDYRLVHKSEIAEQPNSLVFKARHSKVPGKLIAVKLWRSMDNLRNPETKGKYLHVAVETWVNEVQQHYKVREHPSIVTLYGFDARFLSIYMEHVEAPSLQSYCKPQNNTYCKLGVGDAKRVLCGMADAINFVHSHGIIHNDIKPANILYSEERGPVLIDFGSAAPESFLHSGGTRWYIPPEFANTHHSSRGRPGDVFALGVVLLFLLRRTPLPESQRPFLKWDIFRLQQIDAEAKKAIRLMQKWMRMIDRTANRLRDTADDKLDEMLKHTVVRMVAMKIEDRITGPEIVEQMKA